MRTEKRIQHKGPTGKSPDRCKRCVNVQTVCAQRKGSMSSLFQRGGSSPKVLVRVVGRMATTLRQAVVRSCISL